MNALMNFLMTPPKSNLRAALVYGSVLLAMFLVAKYRVVFLNY